MNQDETKKSEIPPNADHRAVLIVHFDGSNQVSSLNLLRHIKGGEGSSKTERKKSLVVVVLVDGVLLNCLVTHIYCMLRDVILNDILFVILILSFLLLFFLNKKEQDEGSLCGFFCNRCSRCPRTHVPNHRSS